MARLCGCDIAEIKADPAKAAKEFAAKYSCVVVLKDADTVVASPDGVAEAIEHKTLPIFGVQWHPELSDNIEIFEKFVSLCKE